MANIGHDHEHSVGSGYDATSDAPVSGWVKLPETTAGEPVGQSNTAGPWEEV